MIKCVMHFVQKVLNSVRFITCKYDLKDIVNVTCTDEFIELRENKNEE